jgi:hypothetical protein
MNKHKICFDDASNTNPFLSARVLSVVTLYHIISCCVIVIILSYYRNSAEETTLPFLSLPRQAHVADEFPSDSQSSSLLPGKAETVLAVVVVVAPQRFW